MNHSCGAMILLVLGAISPAGLAVDYQYDAAGRLVGAEYANGTRITYSYDDAGNLTGRTVLAPGDVVFSNGFEGG